MGMKSYFGLALCILILFCFKKISLFTYFTLCFAGNHMLLAGQNESPADPIGVGHQIHHGVGDGPADQSHQMKAWQAIQAKQKVK